MTESKKDGFIIQAGILAAAGIICRIVGILYRSPLTAIIGDEGNGYYSTAYNIYAIILLLSSYSIPSAVSKVIAGKLAIKEYKNAHRIFLCSIIYVIVVGGFASLFSYFGAGLLVQENSVLVLRVFAPTIFLSGLVGVLRGYFQAHKTMLQTSVSQIIEQILNAVISVLAAYLLTQAMVNQGTTVRAVYGAIGSALGTGAGVLVALIFMLFVYGLNRKTIHKRMEKDRTKKILPYSDIFKIIFLMVTPIILSTFIYNFSTSLNQTIYDRVLHYVKNIEETEIATMYGIFAGKAVTISNIPIALASAMSAAIIPSISGCFVKKDLKGARQKVKSAIQTTMLLAIPSAIGIAALAKPIMMLLFPQKASLEMASGLLRILSITIIFYSLSTLTNAVLQAIGKVNIPVINAIIALVIQTVVLVPALIYTEWNQYCLVLSAVVYSFVMCILNGIFIKKYLVYKQEVLNTFLLPLFSAMLMAGSAFGVYYGLNFLLSSFMIDYLRNIICLVPTVMIASTIYFVLIIKTKAVGKEELGKLPKGYKIIRLVTKLHLIS